MIEIYTQGRMDNAQAEVFRRGFEAAKAAAIEIVGLERHRCEDHGADFSDMLAQIEALTPEPPQWLNQTGTKHARTAERSSIATGCSSTTTTARTLLSTAEIAVSLSSAMFTLCRNSSYRKPRHRKSIRHAGNE